jgi:DNA-binding transcriptional LysR family regulator
MKLNRIDLNLLVAFDALMTERNLTRAAEELSIGQPAMSAALTRVRKLFNDPILVWEGRRWVATPTAEALIEPIREALQAISSTLPERRSFLSESDARTFTLMASDYVVLTFLQTFFARMARDAPHVKFRVKPWEEDFDDQLRRGSLDLMILPREATLGEQPKLAVQDLFVDRYVVAVDADNPLVGDEMTMAQFESMPYVAYSSGPMQSVIELQLQALGLTRPIDITTRGFVIVPFLITNTPFFGLIHERLGRSVQAKTNLKLLEPPMELPSLTEAMFWNPRQADDPANRWLRQRLLRTARDIEQCAGGLNAADGRVGPGAHG